MSDEKIILKAEDLDGYLTEDDQKDLKTLEAMYKDTLKAFNPVDQDKIVSSFDEMGHKMQDICAKHPNIKVFSFDTEEGAHAEASRVISKLRDDDILMITADHGCDPGYLATTDHTREYVPLVCCGKGFEPAKGTKGGNLGTRPTFADIAASVLTYIGLPKDQIAKVAGENIL